MFKRVYLLALFLVGTHSVSADVLMLKTKQELTVRTLKNASFGTFGVMEETSNIQSLDEGEGKLVSDVLVYPSPCPNMECEMGFRVLGGTMTNLKLELFDMTGSKIVDHTFSVDPGYNKIQLRPLLDYQPATGVYHMLLYDEDEELIEKEIFSVITTKGGV